MTTFLHQNYFLMKIKLQFYFFISLTHFSEVFHLIVRMIFCSQFNFHVVISYRIKRVFLFVFVFFSCLHGEFEVDPSSEANRCNCEPIVNSALHQQEALFFIIVSILELERSAYCLEIKMPNSNSGLLFVLIRVYPDSTCIFDIVRRGHGYLQMIFAVQRQKMLLQGHFILGDHPVSIIQHTKFII